jgi:hypothetical protein
MSYAKSRFLPDDNIDSVLCNGHTFIPGDIDDSASAVIPRANRIFEQSSMTTAILRARIAFTA